MKVNWSMIFFILLIFLVVLTLTIWDPLNLEDGLTPPINTGCGSHEECYYQGGAVCKIYNTEGKSCVKEGHTGTGFLGMKDYSTNYYVCEGYGRIAQYCIEYYSWEEFEEILFPEEQQ